MVTKGMVVKQEAYLESGIHIGTKLRTYDMRPYIFKRRDDGLFILDLRKTDERLLKAAKMLAKYAPGDVLVVASRTYSSNPAMKFSTLTGIQVVAGRFAPGTMTNLEFTHFREPKLILVCDPKGEREAILESAKNGIPLIALCDSDNETKFIDLVIPCNNKGKRALALIFYILARELLLTQGKIDSYENFGHDVAYFEQAEGEKTKPKKEKAESRPEKEKGEPKTEAPEKPRTEAAA